jgi:hypothetical protein
VKVPATGNESQVAVSDAMVELRPLSANCLFSTETPTNTVEEVFEGIVSEKLFESRRLQTLDLISFSRIGSVGRQDADMFKAPSSKVPDCGEHHRLVSSMKNSLLHADIAH